MTYSEETMKVFGKYHIARELKEAFSGGELREEWYIQFPMLFDEIDLKLARNQPHYHFYEWLGAIKIFQETGWISLVEKYSCKNHKRKIEAFKSIVPVNIFTLLTLNTPGNQQAPDLFVFSPERTDWFFCEIKGHHDRLRPIQANFFEKIEDISSKKIRILRFIFES